MTVSNNYAPVVTAANGVTTVFTGSWSVLNANYFDVQLLNTTTGVYTPVTQGLGASQYQVTSFNSSGWVITFNTAPASGYDVVISRATTQSQTVPYTTSRGFQGLVEEGSFDALTNMIQELSDQVANSIQVSVGDTTENLILPIASIRASSFLAFDASGNVIAAAGASSVPVSSPMVPVVGAASTAAALALLGGATSNSVVGGYKNKFRNPKMDIWQRGTSSTSISTSGAYFADGWIVTPTGAACTVAQSTSNPRTGRQSLYSLLLTGASSVTDITLAQRIESIDSVALEGQQVTIQAQVYNNTGATITPTIATKIAGSTDNWSSPTTDLAATSLQACPNGAWTEVAYSYTVGSTAGLGLEVIFDFGNNFSTTGKSVQVTELQISITPTASTGLVSSPPPLETRSMASEQNLCNRYYQYIPSVYVVQSGVTVFPINMRATPTISGGSTGFTISGTPNPTMLNIYQTTANYQSLALSAEL